MAAVTRSAATAKALDFTNVKEGGASFNKKRVPMGDYLAKVTKCEDSPTKQTQEPQWLYTLELVDKYTDRKFPYYCKLEANQLWKVRNLFLACGVSVPKRKVKLDPNRVVGKLVAVTLEDDEFDGKLQSNVTQIFAASELEDGEPVDEEETEEEEAEEEEEATDEAEEEYEDEEEEEEEPEPAPAKRKAAASIPAQRKASPVVAKKRAAAKPVDDVDEDDLEALDLDEI